MAAATRCIRARLRDLNSINASLQTRRWQSTTTTTSPANLAQTLKTRPIPLILDDLSPLPSLRLATTLTDFLPTPPHPANPSILPLPHHLVYFNPLHPSSTLLPDGTTPVHSPGEPWTRRLWAGGRVYYSQGNAFALDGAGGVCSEFIRDVHVRGREGEEKVWVGIERRLARLTGEEMAGLAAATAAAEVESAEVAGRLRAEVEHVVRQRLWRDGEGDLGPCGVVERRDLCFLRAADASSSLSADKEKAPRPQKQQQQQQQQQHNPDYAHTLIPTPALLFRFSALTFNAHAIHLDPHYSREIEGHRERLVHGPLIYTLMISLLQQQLGRQGNEVVKQVEYRNLAPLYCGEAVTFCGKRVGEGKWEVWVLGPQGAVAVKGTVGTEAGRIDRADLGV